MPVEKESKLSVWIAALREWVPMVRARTVDWWMVVRENPVLIWQTPAVRYTVIGIGGLIAVLVLRWFLLAMAPDSAGGGKPTRTAQFHVICDSPDCGHHFAITREFKFKKFPVQCPKCNKKTGYRAVLSTSGPDKGQWVIQR